MAQGQGLGCGVTAASRPLPRPDHLLDEPMAEQCATNDAHSPALGLQKPESVACHSLEMFKNLLIFAEEGAGTKGKLASLCSILSSAVSVITLLPPLKPFFAWGGILFKRQFHLSTDLNSAFVLLERGLVAHLEPHLLCAESTTNLPRLDQIIPISR